MTNPALAALADQWFALRELETHEITFTVGSTGSTTTSLPKKALIKSFATLDFRFRGAEGGPQFEITYVGGVFDKDGNDLSPSVGDRVKIGSSTFLIVELGGILTNLVGSVYRTTLFVI